MSASMQPIHHALSTLFTQFFHQAQTPASTRQGLSAFTGVGTALLTPALAWQLLQQPVFFDALPLTVSEWLRFLDRLTETAEVTEPPETLTEAEPSLLMALRVFWLHAFAWRLPHLTQDVSIALTPLYATGHFADPRVLVALHQYAQAAPHSISKATPSNAMLNSVALNTAYAQSAKTFHAYHLDTPLLLAGWCHGLALALHCYSTQRGNSLHPFLINALKACWNDSEQQHIFVQHWLQAMPEAAFVSFRQIYATFVKGRKSMDQIRRTQDRLYLQWQQTKPLKPLIQEALQKLLHQGQVGSVFVFVRHDDTYTPLLLNHTPYAYRQEASQWCWRSHANFSQKNARDQQETEAHHQLQQTLGKIHQKASVQYTGLSGSKAIQSRWWSAGEALLIAALHTRSQTLTLSELQTHPEMLRLQDDVLQQVFSDACERVACEHRAGLGVAEALRACGAQLCDNLCDSSNEAANTKTPFQSLCESLMALPLAQVQQALASLTPDTLALYLCWAQRQTGGVPIDGFYQPLMYENEGQQNAPRSVPAVILWGEVHRLPQTEVLLPFISRLHMHEVAPISDLMGYWASDELLHWRQDLNRLRDQQRRQEEDYQRIQRAFENIRLCREKENLAWAELRNQLDPPELLAYGVASNCALQQAYTRLHRPDHIHSPTALLCFLADLSTGAQHQTLTQAQSTLTQLQLRAPDSLLAELFAYWEQLPLEQQNLSTAQTLFSYCKMIIYDGSQIESQLPGVLTLIQIVHTFHRMAKFTNTLGKKHQRRLLLPLKLHWQGQVFERPGQLHLRRILKTPALQSLLMGRPLAQLQDTHTLTPRFALGQEQLALGFMDCLYALYTTHFSPILQQSSAAGSEDSSGEASEPRLWVQHLHMQVTGSFAQAGFELRMVLSGSFSPTARQKIEQLSQPQGVQHPLPPAQRAHDLRRILHRLRESVEIPAQQAWFVSDTSAKDTLAQDTSAQRGVYFCESVGQSAGQPEHSPNYTTLVVNLPL